MWSCLYLVYGFFVLGLLPLLIEAIYSKITVLQIKKYKAEMECRMYWYERINRKSSLCKEISGQPEFFPDQENLENYKTIFDDQKDEPDAT